MLYEVGKQLLFENGYYEIGMDHFALKMIRYIKLLTKENCIETSWDIVLLNPINDWFRCIIN